MLEASEVAAGQVQEIAGQRNNLGARAIQRFMDQIIVIAVTGAFVQAQDAIGIPTAVAHKASEKIVTAGDAVDGAALGGVQYLKNSLPEFWRDALIGIDHQHPVAGGVILRALALNAIASPVGMGIDWAPRRRASSTVLSVLPESRTIISSAQLTEPRQSGSRSAAF